MQCARRPYSRAVLAAVKSCRGVLVLAASLLTLSCSDSRVLGPASTEEPASPPEGPSAPSALISDALHDDGNPHFFWLAPMVPDPAALNGDFDDSQSPVVRICDLSDCESLEIAAYSMDTGPGSETVRVVPSDEHYIVNWHTDQFDVASGPTYRISVSVSGTELGFADIQLGSNGNEVKNVTTDETIGLKDGRTLPVKFRIEVGAVFAISTADGGKIEALDGTATLEIPAGALDEDTGITVESVPPEEEQVAIVDLGPDGTTFSTPVLVTLAYDEAALNGIDEGDLALNTFEDGDWIIVPGFVRDPVSNTITAPFHHFSQASVGPAAKAVVCPGDTNPNTFDTFDDAIAALMDGGTLTVCGGTHTVQSVVVGKALTIEGKVGTRPVITSGGARFGLMVDFQSGTMTIRNLRFETLWNLGFDHQAGSALVIGSLAGGVVADPYDQVVIEDVELHVAQGSSGENAGSGAWILASDVAGAHVTVRGVTSTGGVVGLYILTPGNATMGASVEIEDSSFSMSNQGIFVFDVSANSAQGAISDVNIDNVDVTANLGVFVARGNDGVGARVDVTNSSFSGGALWYQSGATGLIQGNTIDCGHGAACIRVRSGASSTQPEPVRIIGNQITEAPGGTRDAIWLTELDAGPFEVRDNLIDGTSAGSDRSDPFDYSFHGDGIRFERLEAAGTVTGNSISGAYRGLSTDAGSVAMTPQDNTIATVWTGARVVNGGQMSVHSSDITDYIVPIDPTEPFGTGDLTCNWWGDGNGPQGVDAGIAGDVYTPWATSSVAGTGATTCSGGVTAILFNSPRTGDQEIYLTDNLGSPAVNLTQSPSTADQGGTWSPAGTKIAFVRFSGGSPSVMVMNADGSGQVEVAQASSVYDLRWSPDGTKLAYSELGTLTVINPDGSGAVPLALPPPAPRTGGAFFDWSPDGSEIVAGVDAGGTGVQLYVVNSDGSGSATLIVDDPGWSDHRPRWSPDGSKIVFMCTERVQGGSRDLCFVNPDGTGFARLGDEGAQVPVWSPDGARIAFVCIENGDPEICTMNADGTGKLNLTNAPGSDLEPAWSADGASIAFLSNRDGNLEVYVMDASGGGQTNVTNDPGLDQRPRLRP